MFPSFSLFSQLPGYSFTHCHNGNGVAHTLAKWSLAGSFCNFSFTSAPPFLEEALSLDCT
ncbi:hypothetical protein RchiOBHm_Chr1g0336941 [Rosa chinensis]|uniref:Uncharacterized protein n=1 Tax=Rosa chinensis TaxID=74649 RepID=A0A2P6SCU6_ROSCH|nr:hypothetical protein RchiOBHm_Chr1g0336941 [Rosa chinensis]